MSKKFDTDAYVSRWDKILIPTMLVVIFASMIGAYALNVMVRPDCTTHEYVFCGTPLDEPSEEGEGHHGDAGGSHEASGHSENDPHAAPAESDAHGHPH